MSVQSFNKSSQNKSSQVNSAAARINSSTSIDHLLGPDSLQVSSLETSLAFSTPAYHELLENPHIEIDGLQRLTENLARLEDLHGRLQFLMKDVTGLLRRR